MNLSYFLISFLFSVIYVYLRYKYSYWKKRDVPHLEPVLLLGNLNQLKAFNMLNKLNEIYTKFKGVSPIAGIYLFTKPGVVALDLELIKAILIKDFPNFTDRMVSFNATHNPLSANLFNLHGSKWKTMRTKLSPTFTSGKMKFMFPTVVRVAQEFRDAINCSIEKSNVLEIRELLARYTTDVIGTCVFGIQCNSLKDPDAEFYRHGRTAMEKPTNPTLWRIFLMVFNEQAQKLGLRLSQSRSSDFFMRVIKETVASREANSIQRNDFMNILIELKNKKGLDGLKIEEVAAQAYVFFLAGFETSASNMAFTLFELAKQPHIQDKLRDEICDVLEKHNNELSYETMSKMTYLSQCMYESMRKYPALVSLTRKANKDYSIAGSKLVIEKGTPVLIPVRAIHYDPKIYSNPTKYDPDRFSPENVNARNPITFLGFGDGPRNCIGLRFACMQVRIGLITLLRSFKFSVSEKTPAEISLNPKSFVLLPNEGVWLKVEPLKVETRRSFYCGCLE